MKLNSIVIFAAIVAYFAVELGYLTTLEYNDAKCTLLGGEDLTGSEDLTSLGHGRFLITAGDLHNIFTGEPTAPGKIWVVNAETGRYEEVVIKGYPESVAFQPHGFYFSNSTTRLYVVTHGLKKGGGTRIAIFDLKGKVSDPESKLELQFSRFLEHPAFRNGCLNDIVESSDNAVIITNWLHRPLPDKGLNYPRNFFEKFDKFANSLGRIAVPTQYVLRCTFDEDDAEVPVRCAQLDQGFYSPNGITISSDRKSLFINDLSRKKIYIYDHDEATGQVRQKGSFSVPFMVDNLEYEAGTGRITMGSIPLSYKALQKMDGGDVMVPGGLVTAVPNQDGSYTVTHDVVHDGSKLSQIASAVQWAGTTMMGSPFSPGFLICRP